MVRRILQLFSVVLLLPSAAFSATSQTGFPAKCRSYAVCDVQGECTRTSTLFGTFLLVEEESGFKIVTWPEGGERSVSIVRSREAAEALMLTASDGMPEFVLIANSEVADAAGYDVVRLNPKYGVVSETRNKVMCSKYSGAAEALN